MKITFVGAGYVGLVSGTAFAEMGNDVTFVEVDSQKIDKLSSGKLTIFEPGLEVLFERNLRDRRMHFTTSLAEGVQASEIIFLTLPTPPNEDGSADLSYVLDTAFAMAEHVNQYKVIVTKSTVPVGTADRIRRILEAAGLTSGTDFDVVSNPEFLREGAAVNDFMKPERVVVGTSSQRAADLMKNLYEPFVRNGNPIYIMDERSSEMVKYAANAFLATKISFINEIANVCERVGANVDKVRIGMGKDSRIGSQFLYPGLGYGGSCFPKDVKAMEHTSREVGYDFDILKAVIKINAQQRMNFIGKIFNYFESDLAGKHFTVWGLAFKPNTDDTREAPAHSIIEELLKHGATVTVYDPEGMDNTKRIFGETIVYAKDMYSALHDAEALIIATEWNEFRNPDFNFVIKTLKQPLIFDGRNLYDPDRMSDLGFEYTSIGRQTIAPRVRFQQSPNPDQHQRKAA